MKFDFLFNCLFILCILVELVIVIIRLFLMDNFIYLSMFSKNVFFVFLVKFIFYFLIIFCNIFFYEVL